MAKTRHGAGSISLRRRSTFAPCTLRILAPCGGETETSIRRVGLDRTGVGDQSGGNLNTGGGPNENGGFVTGPLTTTGTGDGNANTATKAFFKAEVFPALGSCVSCHGSGSQGAPQFLDSEPGKAYTELGAYGLVQPESRLLKKGTHGAGKSAPGLDEAAKSVVLEWIARATKENGENRPRASSTRWPSAWTRPSLIPSVFKESKPSSAGARTTTDARDATPPCVRRATATVRHRSS